MEMKFGTTVYIQRPQYFRMGWDLYLVKEEGTKVLMADPESIKWVEVIEGNLNQRGIRVNKFEEMEQVNTQSKLAGEVETLKNENTFLRAEISKMLEKVIK